MTPAEKTLLDKRMAEFRLAEAQSERRSELWVQVSDLTKKIELQLSTEFDADIAAANVAIWEAQAVVDAERVASAPKSSPYPLGTILHEWEPEARWSRKRVLSGKTGVVEVFTADSAFPARNSGRPDPGDIVVRPLNKKGEPGIHCHKLQNYTLQMWQPKGMTPDQYLAKQREEESPLG